MLSISPKEYYTTQIRVYQIKLQRLTNIIRTVSAARLVSFLAFGGFCFYSLYGDYYGGALVPHVVWNFGALLSFGIFIFLLTIHARMFRDKEHTESVLRVNEDEFRALQGNRAHIAHGAEFLMDMTLPTAQAYALDLDIFGQASLFQRINRSVTTIGYRRLAEWLTTPLQSKDAIVSRQKMIQELSQRTAFREEWQAAKSQREMSNVEHEGLQKWLQKVPLLSSSLALQSVLWLLPSFTLFCALLVLWGSFAGTENSFYLRFLFGSMMVQFLFFALFLRRITIEAALLKRVAGLLGLYVRLFRLMREHSTTTFGQTTFQEPNLVSIASISDRAWTSIRELADTMKYFEMGQSMIGAVVLNGTFLWHLHCVRLLERWRKRHGSEVEEWFDALATMDALCSMANFAFNNPQYILPEISDAKELVFRASELAHPFLPADETVTNSLTLDSASGGLVVITGANMAGKSTFLRAIGINSVMALVGLPVCAAAFEVSICEVLSSMRASDSLEKHESYFYAELKRLQYIVERLRQGHPALLLLDEILRGTNSADKKSGTVGLLQQLITLPTLAVIATHDTEIGALESEYPALVRNYCFEGEIQNGHLAFDYTLRRGVANNKNATFLMQQMGIVSV